MCIKVGKGGKVAVWACTRYAYSIVVKDQGQLETARYWLRSILNISKIQVAAVPTHLIFDVPVSRGYFSWLYSLHSVSTAGNKQSLGEDYI
jgi:hypothetical protein